jgi:hypothetical protein
MLDFDVKRCTRRCAKTERELRPGETIYSVLLAEGSEVVRYDYSHEAWEGAPIDPIGWWVSKIPSSDTKKVSWAPNDVMLHFFRELEANPEKIELRYVLCLLMIRRRILRQEGNEHDEQGREVIVVHCPKDDSEHKVIMQLPDPSQAVALQEALSGLLVGGGPPAGD